MVNLNIFKGESGKYRIPTLNLGIWTTIFASYTYNPIPNEEFLIVISIIGFLGSFITAGLFFFELVTVSEKIKKIDTGFHYIVGLLMISAGFFWLFSIVDIETARQEVCMMSIPDICPDFSQGDRLIVVIIALINGLLYVLAGASLSKEYRVGYQEIVIVA